MSLHQRSAPRTLTGVSAAAACIALVVAGCSSNSSSSGPTGTAGSGTPSNGPTGYRWLWQLAATYGFPAAEQIADSPITIWVDADRSAIAEAFKKDHPECPLNVETYDGNAGGSDTFHTKISLLDQAGEGWPDVVWSTQVNDASWAAHEQNGVQAFAAPLDQGVVAQSWLDGYTPGALDPVTVDGHVYGARDNLAPVVLWYNKTLFDEFGYTVPTTWEEYQALGDKVAAEHPGYILGSIGDPFTAVLTNMWAAQAPIYTVDGDHLHQRLLGQPHDPHDRPAWTTCSRTSTLAIDGLFTPDWVAKYKDKVLASLARRGSREPSSRTLTTSPRQPGTWGAGHALHWDGEPIATGNVGGGFWYGSSHSANLACVGDLPAVRDERTPVRRAHHRPPGLRLDRERVVGRAGYQRLLGQLGHVQGRRQ